MCREKKGGPHTFDRFLQNPYIPAVWDSAHRFLLQSDRESWAPHNRRNGKRQSGPASLPWRHRSHASGGASAICYRAPCSSSGNAASRCHPPETGCPDRPAHTIPPAEWQSPKLCPIESLLLGHLTSCPSSDSPFPGYTRPFPIWYTAYLPPSPVPDCAPDLHIHEARDFLQRNRKEADTREFPLPFPHAPADDTSGSCGERKPWRDVPHPTHRFPP